MSDKLVKNIVTAIKKAAKELGKEPYEVTKLDLLSNDYGVSDWDLRKVGGLALVKSAHFTIPNKELPSIRNLKDDRSYITKLENMVGSRVILEEAIQNALLGMPKVKIAPYMHKAKGRIKRQLNLVLSDLHIGSDISKDETGNLDFKKIEESRRLAKIIEETLTYKVMYRNETHLNVLLLGDIIQNQLHDPRDAAPLAEQFARALHLLTQAFAQLAHAFPSVTVYCNTGNHDRTTSRHSHRAVNQKWDSLGTMLYTALKTALSNVKNINFVIPKTPYVTYEVFGKKIFATHGDTVLKVGHPSSSIKTGSLEDQINSINSSLVDKDEYSVFVIGHVHVGSCTHLSNGAVLITNGALPPTDEFATSIGLTETASGQYLFESVEDYPVGDIRFIKVDSRTDKDASLDKLIQKWDKF